MTEVLSRLMSVHGAPLFMRSDNGPEFVSQAVLAWISQAGVATVLNDPGKPWQNGTDESFNGGQSHHIASTRFWGAQPTKPETAL